MLNTNNIMVHTLANGATVIHVSPSHGVKFSDGTSCPAQDKEVCDFFTLQRKFRDVSTIKGMMVKEMRMTLSSDHLEGLKQLAKMADIVLVPLPVILALRELGSEIRDQFPNVVAANATTETMRFPPDQKIWDIDNWSY